jgi:hypothetical protein
MFGQQDLLAEIMQGPILATVLSAARHLERIEIRRDGHPLLSLIRNGPHMAEVSRDQGGASEMFRDRSPFSGTVHIREHRRTCSSAFCARQALSRDSVFKDVKGDSAWPKTWTINNKPVPEKAEPHGAVFLVRHDGAESRLAVHWGVFLPTGEQPQAIIPIDHSADRPAIDLHLFLHGYFFVDSGRRYIEGFEASNGPSGSAHADICGKWNRLVRDRITLPLLPGLFADALRGGVLSAPDLARTVRALASDRWFIHYRAAVASHEQLAEIWDGETLAWRTLPAGTELRPVPAFLFSRPETLSRLFPELMSFARARRIALFAADRGVSTTLSVSDPTWLSQEIADLVESVPVAAFRSRALAEGLRAFLDGVCSPATDQKVGGALCIKLREAMSAGNSFAEGDTIRGILCHVPDRLLVSLTEGAASVEVLQVLAATGREPLAVRAGWLDEGRRAVISDEAALADMLCALESLTGGPQVDRAARAAMELVRASGRQLSTLALHPAFRDIAIFPVTEEPAEARRILSLHDVFERSRRGTLLQRHGATNVNLKPVLAALPTLRLYLTNDKDLLQAVPEFEEGAATLDVPRAVAFVNAEMQFGEPSSRTALVDLLCRHWITSEQHFAAMRRLLAGVAEAGPLSAILYQCDDGDLATLAERLITHDRGAFIAATELADRLATPQARAIGLRRFDAQALESLLERALAAGNPFSITPEQAEKLLAWGLPDRLLKRLPIHRLEDGSLVSLDETTYLASDRVIPLALRRHLHRVRLADDAVARRRQEALIPRHDAVAELRAALSAPDPVSLASVIMDALADPDFQHRELDGALCAKLRSARWLTIGGTAVTPEDVLSLPDMVSEAAKVILGTMGELAWYPQAALSASVRDHRAFSRLVDLVLPSVADSLEKLALQIEEAELVGLPVRYDDGSAGERIRTDLSTLAQAGAQFTLPGWPLAATLLTADAIDDRHTDRCLAALVPLAGGETVLFAKSLDTLAAFAERRGRVGEAAARVYNRAMADLVGWSAAERRAVFAGARVPTAAGIWMPGARVAREGAGLAPRCVLETKLAELVRSADRDSDRSGAIEPRAHHGPDVPVQPLTLDIRELDRISAEGHRDFLEQYRGRIPAELALMYLALVGRFRALSEVAETWASDAPLAPDLLVETIDQEIDPALYRVTLKAEVDQRRFLVEPVQDETVQAVSLAGELFTAATVEGTELLVGNRHDDGEKLRVPGGRMLTVHTLPLRYGLASDPQDAIESMKKLLRSIACDCLWLSSEQQLQALDRLLDRFSRTSQLLLEQTTAMLRERLPTILEPLKARTDHALGRALQNYREAEQRRLALGSNYAQRQTSEQQLWDDIITDTEACTDLLRLTRAKIAELGYDNRRVVLELFQNADDASWQSDNRAEACCFRLEAFSQLLRVVHWGRPINHRGADARYGDANGFDRDLINMLVLNFSDKRPEDGVTGKFGLGFKCVHGLSDSVGIASGLIALRTRGGLLPESWPDGADDVESYRRANTATLIDVPFTEGHDTTGWAAIETFERMAPYLPMFAKAIRSIEIERDGRPATQRLADAFELTGVAGVRRVKIDGATAFSALIFDLGEGYTLVAMLGETGVVPFPVTAPRLWHLAPLDQQLASGWLLNGPFRLAPSRAELHGDVAPLFQRLGRVLGERLALLHRAATADWAGFAALLGLDLEAATPVLFWKRIWDLFRRDLDDPIARELHVDGRGLAALASQAPIVPSGLPFQQLIRGPDAKNYFAGSLTDTNVLESIKEWPSVTAGAGEFATEGVARDIVKLGFQRLQPITMTTILQREFALAQGRIEVRDAQRLGSVLSQATIAERPLAEEYATLRRQVAVAFFRDAANAWRPVSELTISRSTDRAEVLRSTFAPPERRLSDAYTGEALRFVELARAQSGYSPTPELLHGWAERAQTRSAQIAVLRYLIEFDTGPFQSRILAVPPSWLQTLEQVADGPLTEGWGRDDRNRLRALLRNYEPESQPVSPTGEPFSEPLSAERVLEAIWNWWAQTRDDQVETYERAVYPSGCDRRRLVNWNDREAWFTLFALAAFQNFGGSQDGQHRTFVEEGLQRGWWGELAQSQPLDDPEVWLERLKSWSSAEAPDVTYWRWRRALLDLYTIARWLPQYMRIVELLPRAIQEHGRIRLSNALIPSFSPIWQQAGIEAAPLVRTLGIGLNWLLRECVRLGIYDAESAKLVAPLGWATTRRLRSLLIRRLGAGLDDEPSMDGSPAVWGFVEPRVSDPHRGALMSDLDLPLQLITLQRNHSALMECLFAGGVQTLSRAAVDEGDDIDPDDDSLEAAE